MKFGDWQTVKDPQSGCSVQLRMSVDGRIAVIYDDDPPIFKTLEELYDECEVRRLSLEDRWLCFELLRRHIMTAHADMSYIEMAAR